jgi:hypothetical protein
MLLLLYFFVKNFSNSVFSSPPSPRKMNVSPRYHSSAKFQNECAVPEDRSPQTYWERALQNLKVPELLAPSVGTMMTLHLGIPALDYCSWRQNHDPAWTADSHHVLEGNLFSPTRVFHFAISFTELEPTSVTLIKINSSLNLRNQIL